MTTVEEMVAAAEALAAGGPEYVVVTGGDLDAAGEAVDVLDGGGVDHPAARAPGGDPAQPRHRLLVLGGDRRPAGGWATRCRSRSPPPRSTSPAR